MEVWIFYIQYIMVLNFSKWKNTKLIFFAKKKQHICKFVFWAIFYGNKLHHFELIIFFMQTLLYLKLRTRKLRKNTVFFYFGFGYYWGYRITCNNLQTCICNGCTFVDFIEFFYHEIRIFSRGQCSKQLQNIFLISSHGNKKALNPFYFKSIFHTEWM